MKKAFVLYAALITALMLLAVSCSPARKPAAPTGTATRTTVLLPQSTATSPASAPTVGGAPVVITPTIDEAAAASLRKLLANARAAAPRLVESSPAAGQNTPPSGEIRLTFDQPMAQDVTARALAVTDDQAQPVTGSVSWKDTRTLVFKPQQPLHPGMDYLARLDTQATSAQGQALAEPLKLRFQAAGPLQVSQVFPADGAQDITGASTITVLFNRPVVPLVIAEEQANLVNPLEITPAVKGRGQWISTSLYVFRPEGVLPGARDYRVTVKAGLLDAAADPGTALTQDVSWSFHVAPPAIDAILFDDRSLEEGQENVPLDPTLKIHFPQPMDTASVESSLVLLDGGLPIPGSFQWDDKHQQVALKPAGLLRLKTRYTLRLSAAAQASNGGALAVDTTRTFTTVPAPSVTGTSPKEGERGTETLFQIYFAARMQVKDLADNVVFSPALDVKTHSWYNPSNDTFNIYNLEPSTHYTVRLTTGLRDPYGNPLAEEKQVSFTTKALEPSARLVMPYQAVYRVGGPQDFYLQYVNVKTISAGLYQLNEEKFAQIMASQGQEYAYHAQKEDLVWQYAESPAAKTDQRVTKNLVLTGKDGAPLQPGFYFMGMQATPVKYNGPNLDSRLLFVSTENISVKVSPGQLLAWVTGLESGKPSSRLRVRVYNNRFVQVADGLTDQNGLFQTALDTRPELPSTDKNNFQSMWFLTVENAPGSVKETGPNPVRRFGFASSTWGSGASPDSYGLYQMAYRPWNETTAYIYTERPLYRPGQPVYFKGIVRADDDLTYSLPSQKEVEVTISSYKGEVYKETLPLSETGAFDGKLELDSEAALGSYTLIARWPGAQSTQSGAELILGAVSFEVAEYRKPEFQLEAKAAPANLLPGENFTADLAAAYYSGGGLSDAKVEWTLTSDPFTFTPPPEYSAFSFSSEEYDNYDYYRQQQQNRASRQVAQGQGQTDADGKYSLTLKADPAAAAASADTPNGSSTTQAPGSRKLTWEATVTDFSSASVSGRASVVMHQSALYPGIRAKSYVGQVGKEQSFEVTALDWDGKPQPGAQVDVQIVRREWFSVQEEGDNGQLTWKNSVKETPAAQFSAVTLDDKALARVTFTPDQGGVYRAIVTTLASGQGSVGKASTYLWVVGDEYISWAQTNDRSFQLVADRASYAPGDTAELLIASPFQGESWALITLERGHVRRSEVLRLEGNSTLYKLPITADMAPNIYVSALVVKGVDATNPRPSFKTGLARLTVSTGAQSLKVSITPDRPQAAPRDQVRYTIATTSLDDKPVQAEVSLALSDLATLSLLDSSVPPLLDFFYAPRSLSVITGVALVQSAEEFNASIADQLNPTGQGAGSGGGKGGGALGVIEVRQDFPDTAFWQADLKTGADGTASVTVSLPDTLTTWRMDARAVTADTRVGQVVQDLVVSKPLLVRPQAPRFLVVGDTLTLGAAVHNNTASEMSVTVKLDPGVLTLDGPAAQNVQIPAGRQAFVTWSASVPNGATLAELVFSAEGGGYSDASRPPLETLDNASGKRGIPIYRFEAPETVGTSGVLSEDGARQETIRLPETMQVQQGQLKVELSPSLAAGLADGLKYLEEYPYECTEQTISRFLPNLRLAAALKAAGSPDADLEAQLKTGINQAIQKLSTRQNADGGWGWWPGMNSDLQTTTYAAFGLVDARAAGYTVPDKTLSTVLAFLRTHLKNISDLPERSEANRQAFVLYVLARAGTPEIGKTVQLYDRRASLSLYARAYLLQTMLRFNPADERLKTLVADLSSAAILSASGAHWEEPEQDAVNWNTDIRSTAIILSALIETDPAGALNPAGVRWLMSNRTNGRWNGTQETAWSLLALTDWVTLSGELHPDYRYAVAFNGQELAQGEASPANVRESHELVLDVTQLLAKEANPLVFAREGVSGSLYYTAHLNLWLPVSQVQALDRGITLSRQYYRPGDLTHPVTEAKQGDVLLARLTVVAPNTLHYLLVDDPLPAGLESVNTSLNTSPQAMQPDTYDWQRIDTDGWGWWYFSHIEQRDERVVLSTDTLPAGTYVYTYLVRASTPGAFNVIPPTAQEFYFPDVYGRGDGSMFTVK